MSQTRKRFVRTVFICASCQRIYLTPESLEPDLPNEEWRPVSGMNGRYEVSNLGRIRNFTSGHILRPSISNAGYRFHSFWLPELGHARRTTIHSIVLEAFKGLRPSGAIARHLNGDPLDNRAENLAWGTWSENWADSVRHGTASTGTKRPSAKLTPYTVRQILDSRGGSPTDVGLKFGVSRTLVSQIWSGTAWRQLPRP